MSQIKNRLASIRNWMSENNIDVLIIPHEDEYLSEYIPPECERLAWATGFTGSAGIAVILKDKAAIFVDGRYTVQVRNQVDETLLAYKHLANDPYLKWIQANSQNGAIVGYDARLHRANWVKSAKKILGEKLELISISENPIDLYWRDKPAAKREKAILLDDKFSGKSSTDKRQDIASTLKKQTVDAAFLTQLDSIAWLLNIRGTDVPCNPVLLCHAIVYADATVDLFINLDKIPDGFNNHVGTGVKAFASHEIKNQISKLNSKKVLYNSTGSNAYCFQLLSEVGAKIVNGDDPCVLPKACKNDVELQGMKDCHIRDAVAECEFLAWFDDQVNQGNMLDEATLANKLDGLRAEQDMYKGLSFGTISAAAGNAAMCHYSHLNQKLPGSLEMDSVYLVDSGGQYLDGTTDITRTIAVGNPSDFIKKMFTLVLKGHISLGSARFPKGIGGQHVDTLARQFLWHHGYDFDHGTGHGVGCFLNVHEGPHRIGKGSNNVPLIPGMVVSNEPGYYEDGQFGIRCENLVFVKESIKDGLYEFENLTFVPFDTRLIDKSLMTDIELNWLNNYHKEVFEKINPLVSGDTLTWLENATQPI
jgi:Xaa-Pro aminopeptidase